MIEFKAGKYYEGKNVNKSRIIFKILNVKLKPDIQVKIIRDYDRPSCRFHPDFTLWINIDDDDLLKCFSNSREITGNTRLVTLLL